MTDPVIILNGKADCPYCDQADAFLTEHSIPFLTIKYDDVTRQALYDTLGLLGTARTVPQIQIVHDNGIELISGVQALRNSGIQSLFGGVAVRINHAAQTMPADDDGGMVAAKEGHNCCE